MFVGNEEIERHCRRKPTGRLINRLFREVGFGEEELLFKLPLEKLPADGKS
jgi:hypothetical protein